MPGRNDPYGLLVYSIEESEGMQDNFAVRQLRVWDLASYGRAIRLPADSRRADTGAVLAPAVTGSRICSARLNWSASKARSSSANASLPSSCFKNGAAVVNASSASMRRL